MWCQSKKQIFIENMGLWGAGGQEGQIFTENVGLWGAGGQEGGGKHLTSVVLLSGEQCAVVRETESGMKGHPEIASLGIRLASGLFGQVI